MRRNNNKAYLQLRHHHDIHTERSEANHWFGIHGCRNWIYDRKIYDSVVDLLMKLAGGRQDAILRHATPKIGKSSDGSIFWRISILTKVNEAIL